MRFLILLLVLAGLGAVAAAGLHWRSGKVAGLAVPTVPAAAPGVPAAPASLLLFGDSRIAQWKPLPARDYPIHSAGFPGETAIRLEARFPAALQAHRPAMVVFQLGVNDAVAASLVGAARREQALAASLGAIERMTRDARAGGARVLLMEVVPPVRPELVRRIIYRGEVDRYVAALNAALPGIAARHGAEVVRPMAVLAGPDGQVPERFRRDALHFTPDAYDALGALLPQTLEARG